MPPIKVHNVCKTTPQQKRLLGGEEVQWCGLDTASIWQLKLPGGVFVGYPKPFTLTIVGKNAQPDPALIVVPKPPSTLISRYVFKINGDGCVSLAAPPEIVIEASFKATRKPKTYAKTKPKAKRK